MLINLLSTLLFVIFLLCYRYCDCPPLHAEDRRQRQSGIRDRPQLDVLVQPLLLRLRPLCLQRLVALVPPVVQVGGAAAGTQGFFGSPAACFTIMQKQAGACPV